MDETNTMTQRPARGRGFFKGILATAAFLMTGLGASQDAWAYDEAVQAETLRHYAKANEDFAAQRYCDAANGYSHALEMTPLPVLALWLGRAYEKCGDWTKAIAAYGNAIELRPNELWVDVKQQRAQVEAADELAALRSRMARLVIQGHDSACHVAIDGVAIAPETYDKDYPVAPGVHAVAFDCPGQFRERRITVVEREIVKLTLGPDVFMDPKPAPAEPRRAAPPPAIRATASAAPMPRTTGRRYTTSTAIAFSVGGVGLTVGVVMRVLAFRQQRVMDAHCDKYRACDEAGMDAVSKADLFQTQSNVFLLAGLTGVIAGVGLAIAGTEKTRPQVAIKPLVLPTGAGVSFERGF